MGSRPARSAMSESQIEPAETPATFRQFVFQVCTKRTLPRPPSRIVGPQVQKRIPSRSDDPLDLGEQVLNRGRLQVATPMGPVALSFLDI